MNSHTATAHFILFSIMYTSIPMVPIFWNAMFLFIGSVRSSTDIFENLFVFSFMPLGVCQVSIKNYRS